MILESAIILSAAGYSYYSWNSEKRNFNHKLLKICYRNSKLINRQLETLKLQKYSKQEWGHKVKVSIPWGISFEEVEELKEVFKTNFNAVDVVMELSSGGLLDMDIITEPLKDIRYEPKPLEDGEIYLGYSYKDYVKVNLNKFPHVLIAGDVGTGKSRMLLTVLTSIINQKNNIQIYLIQIRKSDLAVFQDCKQVRYMARTLEETYKMLVYLDKICQERDRMLEKHLKYGVYNIVDYNKKSKYKLEYIYVCLDEFAFFNPSGADTKEEKDLKKSILGLIKNITLAGRSSGVFIITSLQKPTNSSIPSDIKSQLCTRIALKIQDSSTSVVILGNDHATKNKEREAIVRTLGEVTFKVPYIDHNLIMTSIEDNIETEHKYIDIIYEGIPPTPTEIKNDGVIDLSLFDVQ